MTEVRKSPRGSLAVYLPLTPVTHAWQLVYVVPDDFPRLCVGNSITDEEAEEWPMATWGLDPARVGDTAHDPCCGITSPSGKVCPRTTGRVGDHARGTVKWANTKRVWLSGAPEPHDVPCVRDSQGDVWSCDVRGVWWTKETAPASWAYIAKKWSPLTEVGAA